MESTVATDEEFDKCEAVARNALERIEGAMTDGLEIIEIGRSELLAIAGALIDMTTQAKQARRAATTKVVVN